MRWLRSERQRASRHHELSVPQRQVAWAVISRLLDYPDEALLQSLPDLRRALAELPPSYGEQLGTVIDLLGSQSLSMSQASYVETFDHTRKCALYLTYFAYGDTRRRGVALVQFKQAYRKAGAEFAPEHPDHVAAASTDAELPDHLCVVLQFGATVDHDAAWDLLLDHRAGVEMLRLALLGWDKGAGSVWAPVAQALCDTLPELRGDDAEAVRRLIEQGPPEEEVGLAPYMIDPNLTAPPQFVGMPTTGGN